jgi:hypothetical protein
MGSTTTVTDLSIDTEGTVYRDVEGKFVRVSWLEGGTRKFNRSFDASTNQRFKLDSFHLVSQWDEMKRLYKLAEQYDLGEEGVTLEVVSDAVFSSVTAGLIPRDVFVTLINKISGTAFVQGVNSAVDNMKPSSE